MFTQVYLSCYDLLYVLCVWYVWSDLWSTLKLDSQKCFYRLIPEICLPFSCYIVVIPVQFTFLLPSLSFSLLPSFLPSPSLPSLLGHIIFLIFWICSFYFYFGRGTHLALLRATRIEGSLLWHLGDHMGLNSSVQDKHAAHYLCGFYFFFLLLKLVSLFSWIPWFCSSV